ncbi:prepilin peptidase [Neoasaia chiangmaiensis]|uniref:Prepilin leader peptidase/N-methyltransferase n=1 Tax=Neoasaia chiangmaiensis TaxID=320497 RepID=A0A1U9KM59_9PROT|nr:A24 family peptidase [Neoasaia chiangmaiensis]AQS86881.1 hypothetical protein A0U93_01755 [Neoasaia chiangmaiensis]
MAESIYLPIIVAPFIGSFLCVVVLRLPTGLPVIVARSACSSCTTPLSPIELIPIVSFLAQGGKCRRCHARIDGIHLLMELAAISVVLVPLGLIRLNHSSGTTALETIWLGSLLGWWLLTTSIIDLRYQRLPDLLTLPLIAMGLFISAGHGIAYFCQNVLAATIGYVFFRATSRLYRHYRGEEGLGGGDAKLLAAAGAWVGLHALPYVVFWGACVTLCGIILFSRSPVQAKLAVPFGPGLGAAIWSMWLLQDFHVVGQQ